MTGTYRGWEIENLGHRRGWWGYAPSYDGADPKQTQSGSTVEELCGQIDCVIEEYPYLARDSDGEAAVYVPLAKFSMSAPIQDVRAATEVHKEAP